MKKIVLAGVSLIAFSSACFGYDMADHKEWWASGDAKLRGSDVGCRIDVDGDKQRLMLSYGEGEGKKQIEMKTQKGVSLYSSLEGMNSCIKFVWENQGKYTGYRDFLGTVKKKIIAKEITPTPATMNALGFIALGLGKIHCSGEETDFVKKGLDAIGETFSEVDGSESVKHDVEYYWSQPFGGEYWLERVIADDGIENSDKIAEKNAIKAVAKFKSGGERVGWRQRGTYTADAKIVQFKKTGRLYGSDITRTAESFYKVLYYINNNLEGKIEELANDGSKVLEFDINNSRASEDELIKITLQENTEADETKKKYAQIDSITNGLGVCVKAVKMILGTLGQSYNKSWNDLKIDSRKGTNNCLEELIGMAKKSLSILWRLALEYNGEEIVKVCMAECFWGMGDGEIKKKYSNVDYDYSEIEKKRSHIMKNIANKMLDWLGESAVDLDEKDTITSIIEKRLFNFKGNSIVKIANKTTRKTDDINTAFKNCSTEDSDLGNYEFAYELDKAVKKWGQSCFNDGKLENLQYYSKMLDIEKYQNIPTICYLWDMATQEFNTSNSEKGFNEFKDAFNKYRQNISNFNPGYSKAPLGLTEYKNKIGFLNPTTWKLDENIGLEITNFYKELSKKAISLCWKRLDSIKSTSTYLEDFVLACRFWNIMWKFLKNDSKIDDSFIKECYDEINPEIIKKWFEKLVSRLESTNALFKIASSEEVKECNDILKDICPSKKDTETKNKSSDAGIDKVLAFIDGIETKYDALLKKLNEIMLSNGVVQANITSEMEPAKLKDDTLGEINKYAKDFGDLILGSGLKEKILNVYRGKIVDSCNNAVENYAQIFPRILAETVDKENSYVDYLLKEKKVSEAELDEEKFVGLGVTSKLHRLQQKFKRDYAIGLLVSKLSSEKQTNNKVSRIDNLKLWEEKAKLKEIAETYKIDVNVVDDVIKKVLPKYDNTSFGEEVYKVGKTLLKKYDSLKRDKLWRGKFLTIKKIDSLILDLKKYLEEITDLTRNLRDRYYTLDRYYILVRENIGQICCELLRLRYLVTKIDTNNEPGTLKPTNEDKDKCVNLIDEVIDGITTCLVEYGVDYLGTEIACSNALYSENISIENIDKRKEITKKEVVEETSDDSKTGGAFDLGKSGSFGGMGGFGGKSVVLPKGGITQYNDDTISFRDLPKIWIKNEKTKEDYAELEDLSGVGKDIKISKKRLLAEFLGILRGDIYDKSKKLVKDTRTNIEESKALSKAQERYCNKIVDVEDTINGNKYLILSQDIEKFNTIITKVFLYNQIVPEYCGSILSDVLEGFLLKFYNYFWGSIGRIIVQQKREKVNKDPGGAIVGDATKGIMSDAKKALDKLVKDEPCTLDKDSFKDPFGQFIAELWKERSKEVFGEKEKLFIYMLKLIEECSKPESRIYDTQIVGYMKNRPLRVGLRENGIEKILLRKMFEKEKYNDKAYLSMFKHIDARIEQMLFEALKMKTKEEVDDDTLKKVAHILVTVHPDKYEKGGDYGESLIEKYNNHDYSEWMFDGMWAANIQSNADMNKKIKAIKTFINKNDTDGNRSEFEKFYIANKQKATKAIEEQKTKLETIETKEEDEKKEETEGKEPAPTPMPTGDASSSSGDMAPPPPGLPLPPPPVKREGASAGGTGGTSTSFSPDDVMGKRNELKSTGTKSDKPEQPKNPMNAWLNAINGGDARAGLKPPKPKEEKTETEEEKGLTYLLAKAMENRRKDIHKEDEEEDNDDEDPWDD